MSLSSAATDLAAYGRERIGRSRIVILVAVIAALAFIVDAPRDAGNFLLRTVLSAILVASFRIWDDLADRDYDRVHHPARVLVRSAEARWFWTLVVGLGIISAYFLFAFGGSRSLSIYTGLIVVLAIVYHGPRRLRSDRFAHTQLVLIKYPVFITLLTAQGFSSKIVLVGALSYLLMSMYEWFDDPTFHGKYLGGRIAVVSAVGLIAVVSLGNTHG